MSAANRSKTDRIAHDNYPTPAWVTRALLEELCGELPHGVWYDPCCGDGAIVRAVQAAVASKLISEREWITCDVRNVPAAHGGLHMQGDYLTGPSFGDKVDLIITNPPFSLADAIARKAVAEAPAVALLLSLSWPKAGKRAQWLRDHPPSCYPIPQPIPFVTCWSCNNDACGWQGSSLPDQPGWGCCPDCAGKLRRSSGDMVGYGWYVWGLTDQPEYRVLPHTSLADRRAAA